MTADPGFPYVVSGTLIISSGGKLTLDPGVIVKFVSGASSQIQVSGTLDAQGTATDPIYFTSLKDDSIAGDTNGDGNATTPAKGDWWRISTSTGATKVAFAHCVLRYGGTYGAIIYCGTAVPLSLHRCTIAQSSQHAIYLGSGTLDANSCIFAYNAGWGVYKSGGTANIAYCNFWANAAGHVYGTVSLTDPTYTDPAFADLAGGDYRLKPNSDCIDTGDPNYTDPDGSRCDRGALLPLLWVAFAKTRADGTPVTVKHATVTCGTDIFGTFAYVEDWDRTAGIKVIAETDLPTGQSVELIGTIQTTDGEREIVASQVQLLSDRPIPKPHAMSNRWVGGGDWRYDEVTGAGQRGVIGGYGLNTIGLLIRTWGVVKQRDPGSNPGWFVITDGSECEPLMVIVPPGVSVPDVGARVAVTAVCSSELSEGGLRPILLTRYASDIQTPSQ